MRSIDGIKKVGKRDALPSPAGMTILVRTVTTQGQNHTEWWGKASAKLVPDQTPLMLMGLHSMKCPYLGQDGEKYYYDATLADRSVMNVCDFILLFTRLNK